MYYYTYLIASSSVFPSSGVGEANGIFVFGKIMDDTFFENIYQSYGIQMSYHSGGEINLEHSGLNLLERVRDDYSIYEFDKENILNRVLVRDFLGKQIGYFSIYSSREIASTA